jgi:hypothetical protein
LLFPLHPLVVFYQLLVIAPVHGLASITEAAAAPMPCNQRCAAVVCARNSESEVYSSRSVSLGRQGRLDYVNFGTYVPRI